MNLLEYCTLLYYQVYYVLYTIRFRIINLVIYFFEFMLIVDLAWINFYFLVFLMINY